MDIATTAVDAAKQIYETLSLIRENKESCMQLSFQLMNEIQSLEELRKGMVSDALPDLDSQIASLASDLGDLLYTCKKFYKIKPGFRGKIKYFVNTKVDPWSIEKKLKEVEKKAGKAYTLFFVGLAISCHSRNALTGSQTLAHGREQICLAEIKEGVMKNDESINQLKQSLGNTLQARPDQSESFNLFAADDRYREDRMSQEETLVLESADGQQEDSYLSCGPSAPRNIAVSLPIGEQSADQHLFEAKRTPKLKITINEAIQEMLSLLRNLHNPKLQTPLSQWVLKAISLSSTLCSPLGLVSESIQLSEMCLSVLLPETEKNPEVFQLLLAKAFIVYAEGLETNEQQEEGLDKLHEALSIYRQLAEREPDTYSPDLASTLDVTSEALMSLGRNEKAADLSTEAVSIMKDAAEKNPGKYESELARLLRNQGYAFSYCKMLPEAANARRQLVNVLEELARQEPETYTPYLPGALKNLFVSLRRLDRCQDALRVLKREVEVRQRVSRNDLIEHTCKFSERFMCLATKLAMQGHLDDAYDACEEVAKLRDGLEDDSPNAHGCALVDTYDELSERLGRHEQAVTLAQKSVNLRSELLDGNSERAFSLVKSVCNLATRLSGVSRTGEALSKVNVAIVMCDGFKRCDLQIFEPLLASCFVLERDILFGAGRHNEALKAASKAAELWFSLIDHDPTTYRYEYARAESWLSMRYEATGKAEDSIRCAKAAIDNFEALVDEDPEPYRCELARAYNILAISHGKLDQSQLALPHAEKALELVRELTKKDSKAYIDDLVKSLETIHSVLSKLGRNKDALDAIKEVVDIYRRRAIEKPQTFKPLLALALHTYCACLSKMSQEKEALKAIREAIDIYKGLEKEKPEIYESRLADSRRLLSQVMSKLSMMANLKASGETDDASS
ncbi:hypothetical protein ACEPAG_6822 [Sanghuangporus baumii]